MMKQKGKSIIILIYIDDVMVVSNTWILIEQMKKTIESEFEMVGLEKNHFCIGIQMIRNQIIMWLKKYLVEIYIDMTWYITNLQVL
jgi:hypothetical protein